MANFLMFSILNGENISIFYFRKSIKRLIQTLMSLRILLNIFNFLVKLTVIHINLT